ncbi:MAG: hypothetical protein J5606_08510 [Bacteroidales bacterium]|nr:hypothetical protein [Bacteroidales bacterium]
MSKINKTNIHVGYKYGLIFGILILAYVLFGFISYVLPEKPIRTNIRATVEANTLPKDYDFVFIQKPQYQLDNFTDAMILNQAYSMGKVGPTEAVMLLPRQNYPISATDNLKKTAEEAAPIYAHYGRYWHGSTFLTRFFLLFADYAGIRILLYIISSLLFVVFFIHIYKISNWITTLNIAAGFLIGNVFMMQFSLQFFFILALSLIGALWCIDRGERKKDLGIVFLIIGSLSNYFDILTTPILSLGIMMVPTILYFSKQNYTLTLLLKKIILFSILWTCGYALTFLAKWVIATLLCEENIIQNAIETVLYRTSTEGDMWVKQPYSRWGALIKNTNLIAWPYFCLVLLANLTYFAIRYFRKTNIQDKNQKTETRIFNVKNLKISFLFVIVGLYPYIWYIGAANHSFIHWWYTYRGQIVSLICFMLGFQYLLMSIATEVLPSSKNSKTNV